jgi:hypothetical protein
LLTEPSTRHYEYADLKVQVASTDPAVLAWLDEFLQPWLEVDEGPAGGGAGCHARVVLDVDASDFAALRRRHGDPTDQRVDCFVLDNQTLRHPTWRGPGDGRTVFDEELDVFYLVNRGATEIRIVTARANGRARVGLMRVVRELVMSHARRSGRLLLHGAALAVDGRGLIIAGPKRGGKTTLLLHALQASGARFVANDRVLVELGPLRTIARGLPSIVSIRPATLELFPVLAARLAATRYRHSVTIVEAQDGDAAVPARRSGPSLTPAQLCAAVGVAPLAAAELAAIVFPRPEAGAPDARLVRLAPPRVQALLAGALFGVSPHAESALFSPEVGSGDAAANRHAGLDPARLETLCAQVIARVPCVECRLGLAAYAGPAMAEQLVQDVLRLAEAEPSPVTGA